MTTPPRESPRKWATLSKHAIIFSSLFRKLEKIRNLFWPQMEVKYPISNYSLAKINTRKIKASERPRINVRCLVGWKLNQYRKCFFHVLQHLGRGNKTATTRAINDKTKWTLILDHVSIAMNGHVQDVWTTDLGSGGSIIWSPGPQRWKIIGRITKANQVYSLYTLMGAFKNN